MAYYKSTVLLLLILRTVLINTVNNNISVAANNTAGLGNVTYKTVKLLPKGNINFLLNIHNENLNYIYRKF